MTTTSEQGKPDPLHTKNEGPMLFSPFTLHNITLKNRIAVSPMCQYCAQDGFANDWHLVHLGSKAIGGAGLVMMEATAVEERGRTSAGDLGLYRDEHIDMLSRIAAFIRAQGAVASIQLAHAGRKASTYLPWDEKAGELAEDHGRWQTIAPSAIPFNARYPHPTALNQEEITHVVQSFRTAARRALQAGFQILEIHAAHGYLIHEFLSPLSNTRNDSYGGSLANRMRILLEIVDSIRPLPEENFALLVRISASDWTDGGLTIEDSVEIARELKRHGVDLVDVSTGGNVSTAKIPLGPGYQVPFAERIRRETGIATGAVGLITEPTQAEEILEKEQADIILLAREMLRNPHWAYQAAHALKADIAWPRQYERAKL